MYTFSIDRPGTDIIRMNSEIKYWHLRNHKLFSVLNNRQIEDLCIVMRYKQASRGEIIYFSGETDRRIYFLKKGKIKIIEGDMQGREIIKEIIEQGDLFGELSMSEGDTGSEYAQALSDRVDICSFKWSDFEMILNRFPELALGYTKLVGFRFRKLRNNYRNLVFKDVRERLYQFMYDWSLREGNEGQPALRFPNYLTHQDIAGLICSTRQTVTQLLNELEEKKVLEYGRKEIVILRPEDLKARIQ